jgi:Predicted inhibitor of MCP methylation, homolog of CheC
MTQETDSVSEDLSQPFISATLSILSSMAGMSASVGKPYLKKTKTASGSVSAIVGVTGDMRGSIAVSFSHSCATALVKGMLGSDIQDSIEEIQDAVGEVANMISGQARAGLKNTGLALQGSTPTVIMGDNHIIRHISNAPANAIPFETASGSFTVEYCLE